MTSAISCRTSLAQKLASSNPEAMQELKKIFWAGTEHWDQLLIERAGISGTLVLSDFTRTAIQLHHAFGVKQHPRLLYFFPLQTEHGCQRRRAVQDGFIISHV